MANKHPQIKDVFAQCDWVVSGKFDRIIGDSWTKLPFRVQAFVITVRIKPIGIAENPQRTMRSIYRI